MKNYSFAEIMDMTDKERKDLEWLLMDPKPVTLNIDGQIVKGKRKLRNRRNEGSRAVCDVIYKGTTYAVRFIYGFNWTNICFN